MGLGTVNLALEAPVDSPRDILVSRLDADGATPVDWARRARVPFEVVDELLRGEYPRDPKSLHVIGRKLDQPAEAWARRLAAGLTERSEADAAASLHGRLWAWLIQSGISIDAAAKFFDVGVNSIYNTLRSGRASTALATEKFFTELGVGKGDPLREVESPGGTDQALSALLKRALQATNKNVRPLAEIIGMDPEGLQRLVEGHVSTRLKPTSVPLLARELRLDVADLASRIAKTWRTQRDCTGTLKYLVSRYLLREGMYQATFAKRTGISEDVIKGLFRRDTIPYGENLECIRKGIGASREEIQLAVRSQGSRRIADSVSYHSLGSDILPLNQRIIDEAQQEGLSISAWATKHGIPKSPILDLVNRGHVPRRTNVVKPLMEALGIDRVSFNVALRKMTEVVVQGTDPLDAVEPTSAAHESLLRLHKQVPVSEMAKGCDIGARYLRTILRSGLALVDNQVREKIRRYLRVEPATFARMVSPIDDEPVDDDDEMRLLRAYRKLSSSDQYRLREIAGRLLTNRRFDTFVAR